MDTLIELVHIDRSHSINGTAFHRDTVLLFVVGCEMFLNVSVILFHPVFCYVVMKSRVVHRNVRLQLCTAASVNSLGALARFYLFYCQYTGVSDHGKIYVLHSHDAQDFQKLCTVISQLKSFAILPERWPFHCKIGSFAIERTFATYCWKWYEKASWSTITVFILTESFNLLTVTASELLKYAISVNACFTFMVLVEVFSFIAFLRILRHNTKLSQRMATENELYSVAHKFQIQENLEILRFMCRMVKIWLLFVSLSFAFYGFFEFGPNGLDIWRNISYCVFEVLSALHFSSFYYLGITGSVHIRKQFIMLAKCFYGKNTIEPIRQRDHGCESARYFADLRQHWN